MRRPSALNATSRVQCPPVGNAGTTTSAGPDGRTSPGVYGYRTTRLVSAT